jgi:hypothetical protein
MPCAPILLSQHLVEYVFLFLHKQPNLLPFLGDDKLWVGCGFCFGVATVLTRIGIVLDLTIKTYKVLDYFPPALFIAALCTNSSTSALSAI